MAVHIDYVAEDGATQMVDPCALSAGPHHGRPNCIAQSGDRRRVDCDTEGRGPGIAVRIRQVSAA
jgi:hypothetical protein